MGIQQDGYLGQADPMVWTHTYNALKFMVDQVFAGNWTITLGLVMSVTGGGVSSGPPIVGVQPMVNEIDGFGNPTPHGTINNVPVFRLGGGQSAFVVDPIVGDIGLLAIASSDISAVKVNKAPSNPGSFRKFSPSDAVYFGAILSAAPNKSSIQLTSSAIIVTAGTAVITINYNGTIIINGGTALITVESAGGVTLKGSVGVFNVT